MRGVHERPAGFTYQPELVDVDEERSLLTALSGYDFGEVRMHGQIARRTVRQFGFRYDYGSFQPTGTVALPLELHGVRERCAALAGVPAGTLAQALVTRYPAASVIGWNRDAPAFGPTVIGVSLGSACRLRFQRGCGPERRVYEAELAPRSAYVLAGAARTAWQYRIPPVPELRYSITIRQLGSA